MAKIKLDTQKLKQLMQQRVELVALGVTGFLALLLFVVGVLMALRTESQIKKSKDISAALSSKLAGATPDSKEDKNGKKLPEWAEVPIDRFPTVAWYHTATDTSPKKRNPKIRPVETVTKVVNEGSESFIYHCQVFPIVAGVFQYDWRPRQAKIEARQVSQVGFGGAQGFEPTKNLVPQRMALVVATFPYREQVKDYLKALRIDTVEELRSKGLLPTFLGLNVYRGEPGADGKVNWKPLYSTETGRLEIDPGLKNLLQISPFDTVTVEQYGPFMVQGADMPLPKLGRGKYPKFTLPGGIEPRPVSEPTPAGPETGKFPKLPPQGPITMPKGGVPDPGEAKEGPPLKEVSLSELPKSLQDQLKGKFDLWNPVGVVSEDAKKGFPGYGFPGMPSMKDGKFKFPVPQQPPGKKPDEKDGEKSDDDAKTEDASKGATTLEEIPEKILIRFLDVGLKPGQMYQYRVQVRMKNPNYKKEKEVAYTALARAKELTSPKVYTPLVNIPEDFAFYVMDQSPLATKVKSPRGAERNAIKEGMIPVQIHQFVGIVKDDDEEQTTPFQVADWVIAERIFVGRGQVIGRRVEVEVPVWDDRRDEFVLGWTNVRTGTGKGSKTKPHNSLVIKFGPDDGPVLADFWGGKASEGNVEALVWGPDGSLVVRNCHEDSARPKTSEERALNPFAAERQERYDTWRARVERARPAPSGGGVIMPGKGPIVPGKGPFPGKGPVPGKG
jgi:hypothetical protein